MGVFIQSLSTEDFSDLLVRIAEGLLPDSSPPYSVGLGSQPLGCDSRLVDFFFFFLLAGMMETVEVLSLIQTPCLFPQSRLNSAGSA